MKPFLDSVASYIIDNYSDRMAGMSVVMPNRRSGLFLKKYMAKKIDKPVLLPAIYSIEDLIIELSGFRLADPVSLLFELYDVHCRIEKEQAQPFDDFLHWGKVLLRDFNEIDSYLIDTKSLFSYISEAKALSVWNLNEQPLTTLEKNYMAFYSSLYSYYTLLTESLTAKKLAYEGLASRHVVTFLPQISEKLKWHTVLFCGFNALTKAEEKIIEFLVGNGKAEILFDADAYYVSNPKQEAGNFIRKYIESRQFGEIKWINNDFLPGEKQITVIGVAQNIGQVKVAGQIIQDIRNANNDLQNTAVVLSEENLLIPLLNSLPGDIGEFNVTMGYPLIFTPVYDLFETIFTMHENAGRFFNLQTASVWKYYYKDAFRVLNHPYVLSLGDDPQKLRETIAGLQNTNKIFFTDKELEPLFKSEAPGYSSVVRLIFQNWDNQPTKALQCFLTLLESFRDRLIADKSAGHRNTIEIEYIFHFARIIRRITGLSSTYNFITNTLTLRNIFKQIVTGQTIPFFGEPLKGLQIMGMLETRTLDFANLIMLSVNEDILPKSKVTNTFIPYDIRVESGLPTYRDSNAIYAYHFYRLLQRSKQIFLLYNTEPGELGGGDKSRFITQIINELPLVNPHITISEKLLNQPPEKDTRNFSITIDKSDAVVSKLLEKARKGLAPSALNAYRKCSLQFYFREIAKLAEAEEVEETIEAVTLGKVVHDVMYRFYKPWVDKLLTTDAIDQMMQMIDKETEAAFGRHYQGGDIRYGKNLLTANVARMFIRNLLQTEKQFISQSAINGTPPVIRFLEQWFETMVDVKMEDRIIPVKLKGKIDRIDQVGALRRIIDYKTGNIVESNLKVKRFEDMKDDAKADISFQLLVYAYIFLLQKSPGDAGSVVSGVLAFHKHSQGLIEVKLPRETEITIQTLDEFKNLLDALLFEMFDQKNPFTQTTDSDNCKYCPFKGICNR
jgi:CRISPR/Cas system-associated exonuclease Cas4 (RecB family)